MWLPVCVKANLWVKVDILKVFLALKDKKYGFGHVILSGSRETINYPFIP